MPSSDLERCEEIIGYQFKNRALFEMALTHASLDDARSEHNERLEFLGDAILGMVVCDHLFSIYPGLREGELTRIKSAVVSRSTLARKIRELALDEFLRVGKGMVERAAFPRSVLANVYEAITAAIYLDSGLGEARRFIMNTMEEEIAKVASNEREVNFKSLLQQHTQRHFGHSPKYRVLEESGPDHMKSFRVAAVIGELAYGVGVGRNKKEAEQAAARITFELIQEREKETVPAKLVSAPHEHGHRHDAGHRHKS